MAHVAPITGGSYQTTLTPAERRLASRLEGFGDIVFGFAVSQCALQLPTIAGHVDLTHPVALFSYAGTFALLASLWLTYHRVLSGTYRPAGIDLGLSFVYLALVSLMPFAMYSLSHHIATIDDARVALTEYAALFAALMAIAALMTVRGIRRGWWFMTDSERLLAWIQVLRRCTLVVVMCASVVVDQVFGPIYTSFAFIAIPLFVRLVHLFVRTPPSAGLLGIPEPVGAQLT